MHDRYRNTVVAVVLMFVSLFALVQSGCGGGGGGGNSTPASTSTPTTPTTPTSGAVELTSKTALSTASAWGTDTISVTSGTAQVVLGDIKVLNGTTGTISPSAFISIPEGSGITLVPGSVTVDYPEASRVAGKTVSASPDEKTVAEIVSGKRSAGRSAAVADTIDDATTTLGFSLVSGQWGYLYFGLQISANATVGTKVVTVNINGVATKVTINIVAGGGTVCQAVTNPTCGANEHLVVGTPDANNCATVGTCVQNACPTVTNPSCASGTHLVAGANDANGCPTNGSCVQDACPVVSNPSCASGTHSVPSAVVNGCQQNGTCVADAVTTGTVSVCSNLNFANITVTCAGQAYSHYMNPVGNKWCYDATMNVGACSLSNTAQIGYTISSSVTTGTLTTTTPLALSLTYTASGGTAAVCGNGTVESGEQCDDHNTANGDGCSSTCRSESVGPGEPGL
jgi:cysteine-rich repeat protein